MSVSFCWEVVKPTVPKTFRHGTSNDIDPLDKTFGRVITSKEIPMLRAMHRATRLDNSLWNDIADTLERLQGDDCSKDVSIKVWTEF